MSPSNTRRGGHGRPSHSSARSPPPKASIVLCCCIPIRMPSVFNIIRACIYAAVLVWTVICLAIAVHFQNLLESSDLTRFVPFAIFVCSASLLIILALLGFGLWRDRNPISTRLELGCLGLAGVLWLALGAFLGSSDSADSDVECFSSVDSQEPLTMPGFDTETYHAQYRVLEAFSFFNIILIWAFLLMLLGLAIRHHRWGHRYVWTTSVTAYPWFAGRDAQTGKLPGATLPPPVSAKRSTSRSQPRGAAVAERPNHEKRPSQRSQRPPQRRPSETRRDEPTRNETPTYVYWIPHTPPEKAVTTETSRPRDKYHRDASPRR